MSDCDTAKEGGRMGPFAHTDFNQEYTEAALDLEISEASPIMDTPLGVHILFRTV